MKEKIEFKGLIADLEFKYLFSHKEILKDFINSYFKYIGCDKEVVFTSIDAQKYIASSKKDIKNFINDIVCTLNTGEIIILEAYTSFSNREYKKSCNYMARHYSNQIKKNHDYEETKKVICLNIMMGNFQKVNEEIVNKYKMLNDITYKMLNDSEMEIVLIRLDKVSKIVYTENRFIKWLKFINAKDFLELEKIGKDDEIMEHSIEYLKSYCGSSEDHNFEDYVAEKEYLAKKEGILDTAKKLLKMGLPLEKISEGTGLSQKEVESLKKEL